jgi:hypothetical protein
MTFSLTMSLIRFVSKATIFNDRWRTGYFQRRGIQDGDYWTGTRLFMRLSLTWYEVLGAGGNKVYHDIKNDVINALRRQYP